MRAPGSSLFGSCPKSVIEDKRFRDKELRLCGLRGGSPKLLIGWASVDAPPGMLAVRFLRGLVRI